MSSESTKIISVALANAKNGVCSRGVAFDAKFQVMGNVIFFFIFFIFFSFFVLVVLLLMLSFKLFFFIFFYFYFFSFFFFFCSRGVAFDAKFQVMGNVKFFI